MRAIPIIPTLLVVAAMAMMVWLGFWQLGRADEKAELIARFDAIPQDAPAQPLGDADDWLDQQMFRRVTFRCEAANAMRSTAGTAANGAKGFAHIAQCTTDGPHTVEVGLGWSRDPKAPDFSNGVIEGIVDARGKVIADPALADLYPLATPDPKDLPNNHLAYAGQWFFFALTALFIYGFTLRSRWRKRG